MNFLKMKDICLKLGVGQRTIFNYIKKGMPAYKVGKAWRFDEKEVEEWIKKK
ncbi:MAG TPA: helix-turn-helix domain-containing protein [Methanosarcinales archaeon]|nr:helix-turn-helix domain-containing protein [Methanosarcinales archaeon]